MDRNDRLFQACYHGHSPQALQEIVSTQLGPHLEGVLADPRAKEQPYRKQSPSHRTITWALEEKSYDLLTYLLAYGWDINQSLHSEKFGCKVLQYGPPLPLFRGSSHNIHEQALTISDTVAC
jgi:hypothetical protein